MVQAGRILIAGLAVYNAFPTSARVQTPVTGAGQGDGATMRREEGDATIVRSMSTAHGRSHHRRWSSSPLGSSDFALEWKLDSGGGPFKYDGAVALLITPTPDEADQMQAEPRGRLFGSFYGIDENFFGLAVIIEAKQDPNLPGWRLDERHRRIILVAGDGARSYEGLMDSSSECSETMTFGDKASHGAKELPSSRIRLKMYDNTVALDIDHAGQWRRCATMDLPEPPTDSIEWASKSYVGVVPQTKGLDKFTFLNTVVNTIPNATWETDEDEERVTGFEPTYPERLGVGVVQSTTAVHAEPMQVEVPKSSRAKRILGKNSLKHACMADVDFAYCQRDSGSVHQLETCLKKRGSDLSERCREGIKTWKNLLAETAPEARSPPQGGSLAHHDKLGSLKHTRDRGISKHDRNNELPHRADGTPPAPSREAPRGGLLREWEGHGRLRAPPDDLRQRPHALDDGGRSGRHHARGRGSKAHDSPDRVGVIAIFGCVAGVGVLAFFGLYFFVLVFVTGVDRLVKWLGRDSRGHRGGGYQTLPGGSTPAAATAAGSGQRWFGSGRVGGDSVRDDDSVVVTGTPVNPPPSVQL